MDNESVDPKQKRLGKHLSTLQTQEHTAIPEAPFNNKFGIRAGSKDGSFCELSKFGTKSTYSM